MTLEPIAYTTLATGQIAQFSRRNAANLSSMTKATWLTESGTSHATSARNFCLNHRSFSKNENAPTLFFHRRGGVRYADAAGVHTTQDRCRGGTFWGREFIEAGRSAPKGDRSKSL